MKLRYIFLLCCTSGANQFKLHMFCCQLQMFLLVIFINKLIEPNFDGRNTVFLLFGSIISRNNIRKNAYCMFELLLLLRQLFYPLYFNVSKLAVNN